MKKIKRQRNSSKPHLAFPEKLSDSAYVRARPYMDYDYLHKLNKEEKAFLKEFNKSHYLSQPSTLTPKPNTADSKRRRREVQLVFGHKDSK
jgi:hypothetical protein